MLTHNEIFKKEVADCSPDARFLLEVMAIQWSRGDRGVRRWTVSSLSKLLHSPLTMVRKALLELVGLGLVELSTERSRNGGRPAHEYALGDAIRKWFESNSVDYGHHPDRMATLLSGAKFRVRVIGREAQVPERQEPERDGEKRPVAPEGFLSVRNRLLLGTLLSRADRFGCVRGLPTKELQKLTGMNSDRVKHRLGRLVSLGLIRTIVPGASSPIFREGRLPSTFYLNLNHSGFGETTKTPIFISIIPGDAPWEPLYQLTLDLDALRAKRRSSGKDLPDSAFQGYITPEYVLRFLLPIRPSAHRVFDEMLSGLAADLLARNDYGVIDPKGRAASELRPLLDQISGPAPVVESRRKASGHQSLTDEVWFRIREYFCAKIIELANFYRARLALLQGARFDGVRMRVLPVRYGSVDQILSVLFDAVPAEQENCTMVIGLLPNPVEIKRWSSEHEIPLAVRVSCGLLSKPKGLSWDAM